MQKTALVRRECSRRYNDDILARQVEYLATRAVKPYRRRWEVKASAVRTTKSGAVWTCESKLTFTNTSTRSPQKSKESQWETMLERLADAGQSTKFNKYPWQVLLNGDKVQGKTGKAAKQVEIVVKPSPVAPQTYFSDLNLEAGDAYSHLYDLDDQITMTRDAIREAVASGFRNRFNVVLYGPPGCGKTDVMRTTGRTLGEENEAYMHLDATSSTAAGVSKVLMEADEIPPFLFAEEIEKADEHSLRWLLGVTDIRGEIRRTNYRVGHQSRRVNMLCIASVNDMDLFGRIAAGALKSRFSVEVHFPRPGPVTLSRILRRELEKVRGDDRWIKPTVDYAVEQGITDPRKIIPIMLCGRDKLLDNSYQDMLKRVRNVNGKQ